MTRMNELQQETRRTSAVSRAISAIGGLVRLSLGPVNTLGGRRLSRKCPARAARGQEWWEGFRAGARAASQRDGGQQPH